MPPRPSSPPNTNTNTVSQYPTFTPSIPYTTPPHPLQTLSLWLPRPLPASTSPDPSLAPDPRPFLIYLHGGAWRDPHQTRSTIAPTLSHLASHPTLPSRLAAVASLDYRLSPHPAYPSNNAGEDDAVRHPAHLNDVRAALQFLRDEYGMREWVGVGHSAGATLLMQCVAGIASPLTTPSPSSPPTTAPETSTTTTLLTLILLSGIYNLPQLLASHSHPTSPHTSTYASIISSAFGPEKTLWRAASPALVAKGTYSDEAMAQRAPGLRRVVLGWSAGDEVVQVCDLTGSHDEVWQDGGQIVALIGEVLGRLGA
ncbi:Alpha/Beta hydrolase protein [Massariosphaeria phaeospora]|uniref:Alpha/Beta hydrolase protein n=1 Tax=Massariosphaeria phaeospora TaxID=100035 RepID=A0A7C8M8N2_9PLEO|nr:Alpha/Beta hydrolase protein [Massariosphaeria phaeospora]